MKGRMLERRAKEHRAIEKSREARRRKLSDYPPFSVTHPLELTRKRERERGKEGFQAERGNQNLVESCRSRHIEAGKNKIPAAGR